SPATVCFTLFHLMLGIGVSDMRLLGHGSPSHEAPSAVCVLGLIPEEVWNSAVFESKKHWRLFTLCSSVLDDPALLDISPLLGINMKCCKGELCNSGWRTEQRLPLALLAFLTSIALLL
uniref:UPAR/Ly6 domain-containing protein n=1 Tax=Paramormyrops kingsleyae TaxID=1676925 RepID=A0A3B3Q3N9_9TELE